MTDLFQGPKYVSELCDGSAKSAVVEKLFECIWPFCGVGALKVNPSETDFHTASIPINKGKIKYDIN